MSNISLIISDIDGTVIGKDHMVDEALLAVIDQVDRPFILASGRSPYGIHPIARKLGVSQYPIVAYNGALVLEHGKNDSAEVLFSHSIVEEEASLLIDFLNENFSDLSINIYSNFSWFINRFDSYSQKEAQITGDKPVLSNLSKLVKTHPAHKFMLIGSPDRINQALEGINSLKLKETSAFLSQDTYLEIVNSSSSKGNALSELVDYFNLSLDNVFAIGDHINDLSMLELAGTSVAMGNANPRVKEIADYITGENINGGVAQALEKFVLE